jgi:hypothetical protein
MFIERTLYYRYYIQEQEVTEQAYMAAVGKFMGIGHLGIPQHVPWYFETMAVSGRKTAHVRRRLCRGRGPRLQ